MALQDKQLLEEYKAEIKDLKALTMAPHDDGEKEVAAQNQPEPETNTAEAQAKPKKWWHFWKTKWLGRLSYHLTESSLEIFNPEGLSWYSNDKQMQQQYHQINNELDNAIKYIQNIRFYRSSVPFDFEPNKSTHKPWL